MNTPTNTNGDQYGRLVELVIKRIEKRRLDRVRIAAFSYGLVSLGTLVAVVPAYRYMALNAVQSGFSSYISLIATDGNNLAGSWSSLMMSLVESVPIEGTLIILGTLCICTYSARKMFTDIQLLRTSQLS